MKSDEKPQAQAGEQVRKSAGGKPKRSHIAHFPTFPLSRFHFALGCSIYVAFYCTIVAAPLKINLPAETDAFKPAPGVEFANGQCLVCHSVEYVAMQPPASRTFWATSVKKMREKYGAAVAEEQVEPLVDYLTKHYGVESTNDTALAATAVSKPVTLTPPGIPINGAAVATNYWCLSCHDISARKVGPPYKDIADKYRNDSNAHAKIAEQIQKGGSGKWGPVVMPPFPMVSEAETKAVAEWILSQK